MNKIKTVSYLTIAILVLLVVYIGVQMTAKESVVMDGKSYPVKRKLFSFAA